MYGRGSGVVGVSSTVSGVAALPNTGSSTALTVLSIATIVVGVLVTASFVVTRFYHTFNR